MKNNHTRLGQETNQKISERGRKEITKQITSTDMWKPNSGKKVDPLINDVNPV